MAKIGRSNKMKARKRVARQKKLSKAQTSAVKTIVKRTIAKTEETKFFVYGYTTETTGVLGSGVISPVSFNLFYHGVTRGPGNNQLLGDKLRWKGIAIKYRVFNAYQDITGFVWNTQPVVLDMLIVGVPIYKTSVSLTWSELRNDTSSDPNTYFLNPNVKVLFKKTVRITPDRGSTTAQQRQAVGKIWLKRGQVIQYKDFESDYSLKNNMNYYLVFMNRSPTTEKCNITFSYQSYFSDS